jgi:23S rRNA (adenine2503-C2)-methyltransferase
MPHIIPLIAGNEGTSSWHEDQYKNAERVFVTEGENTRMVTFIDGAKRMHHAVLFHHPDVDSVVICVSTQIGCTEDCSFCATGRFGFLRNLTAEEMERQYLLALTDYPAGHRCATLCILTEGMGEVSHNIDNALQALRAVYPLLARQFQRIVFRVSSAGNTRFIGRYMEHVARHGPALQKVEHHAQLSLHTPFEAERLELMPSISRREGLSSIVSGFSRLGVFLRAVVVCNYMLLDLPERRCNYTQRHLDELIRLLDSERFEIKLTRVVDTGSGLRSPNAAVFEAVRQFLASHGFRVKVRELIGSGISAACGMLHYDDTVMEPRART